MAAIVHHRFDGSNPPEHRLHPKLNVREPALRQQSASEDIFKCFPNRVRDCVHRRPWIRPRELEWHNGCLLTEYGRKCRDSPRCTGDGGRPLGDYRWPRFVPIQTLLIFAFWR
jgi:hypothetical protein